MKPILRLIIIIITSPIWLFVAAIVLPVTVILFLVTLIVSCIEYGFTGKWEWLN